MSDMDSTRVGLWEQLNTKYEGAIICKSQNLI